LEHSFLQKEEKVAALEETRGAGETPKFRGDRRKQKREVQKCSSFRTQGIPRIVGNGEIKNSFLIRKENSTKSQNRGRKRVGGIRVRNNIPLLYYRRDFFMFILVYDCYIGRLVSLLTSSKKAYFRFVYDHSRLLCR
jgi:hypothetical protein